MKLPKKQSTTIYGLTVDFDKSPRFGRLQFFLHIVASMAVCYVSFLMFGLAFPHLIAMVGCSVWQVVVTQKRLDDCGINNMHAVPLAVVSIISLIDVLFSPTMSLNSPVLSSVIVIGGVLSLWAIAVFVACLFQPGKASTRNEA
jgi:uncharacterized membrane protein YhaH (DUF805 family)